MNPPKNRSPMVFVLVALVLAVAVVAFVKRDAIAGLILKGGDTSLTGEPAQGSPEAKLAIVFLAALRGSDLPTLARLTTAEQSARIQQEAQQPTPEYQDMKTAMLGDLPAEPAELRARIKSVQIHENRGVVTFETKANSWLVMLEQANGSWKVSGF